MDALPETHGSSPSRRPQPGRAPVRSPRGRWTTRGLLALGLAALLASGAAIIARATSSQEAGPKLTHTISRGELLVTVSEEGILESSENTEIKCQVRGRNIVTWVIESGSMVKPGDELLRLDTLFIEEQIDERTKYALWSRSSAERAKANVARAELAISEYEEGQYVSELMTLEKDFAIAESRLRSAKSMLRHARMMAESGYVSDLDVEEKEFAVTRARLELDLKQTQIDVLKRFTKEERLQTLRGDLAASRANYKANAERAMADASRRDRALEEFKHCVIRAERSGLVIHRSAADWEAAPLAEGATVYKDQVLLLMPDLSQMRVKVGIHESDIDRMKPGLAARVTLPDKTLDGVVSEVASVTAPTGWWTGNEVKYDTFVKLPPVEGLRPGMSAEVEVLVARYEDVLTIPIAAIVETEQGDFCWVKTAQGARPRAIRLGDSNNVFTIVEAGLKEGDEVVLNPFAFREAQMAAAKTQDKPKPEEPGKMSDEAPSKKSAKKTAKTPDKAKPKESAKTPDKTKP